MNTRKKPNYKLRRNIAKAIIVLIILIPIVIANRVKILNLTVYIPNMKYSKVIDAFFEVKIFCNSSNISSKFWNFLNLFDS